MISGPFDVAEAATRPAAAGSSSAGRPPLRRKRACARTILATLARRAYRRPVTRRRRRDAAGLLPGRPQRGQLRGRHPARARAAARAALNSCSASSAIRPDVAAPARLPDQRSRTASRLSFFLWSSIPGRRAARPGRRGAGCSDPAVLERQVRRMLADPRSIGAGRELRRPVAAWSATSATLSPDPRPLPRVRRESARGVPARNRAVPRQHIIREDRERASSC